MRESRTPGSVRGVLSNEHPYRDSVPLTNHSGNGQICHLRLLGGRSAGEAGDNLGLLERDVRAVAAT